ncbi:ABC transporter substrate-binding protein [Mesorhizobium sp. LHD-90]|uniref:ABC transporter substrate-binding protein n=1 Tax=Mesorhizobium sp. LHD-90 TaxID=3071414 RepID=UPI0027E11C71|nr:ABC transporter substrate-binding protein [Mesorhizobium sp. LHD-90]MDQ6435609.1 ABC transporter substrate-binding protein [Mesorhizobium sp. LHD-90]
MTPRTDVKLLAAAALLAVAQSGAAAAAPFVVNTGQAPATIDPAYVCDIADNGYVSPLYAPLLTYARKSVAGPDGVTVTAEDSGKIVGNLAESYTVSKDGLTITIKLKPGLKFASGNPLDGPAAAASLNRALKSGGCGSYYMEAAQTGNTQSIAAPDAGTVVITLKKPEPLVVDALTQPNLGMVDVKTVDANGGKDWLATNAAGSGPYMLKSYQPGVRAEFVANPNWSGAAPLETEITVNFISDPSALLLQARNGGANVTLGMPQQALQSLAGAPDLKIVSVPASRWLLASLPNKQAPFDNVKVRQALSYATPYEAILKSVLFGYGDSFYGPFPPAFATFKEELGAARPYDLEKAKALIAESGVPQPIVLDLAIREGLPAHEQIATILQGAWKQIGVDVRITKLSASAFAEAVVVPQKAGALIRFDGPSIQDPAWLLNYDLRCASPYNTANYCSADAEALLDEALPLADAAKRQEIWDKIAALWIEDAPRIPLYADRYTAVLSADVKHWDFSQDGPFELQLWGR